MKAETILKRNKQSRWLSIP